MEVKNMYELRKRSPSHPESHASLISLEEKAEKAVQNAKGDAAVWAIADT